MADDQTQPTVSALTVDRAPPIGNSQKPPNGRNRLHVLVDNAASEPIPVSISMTPPAVTPGFTQPYFAPAVPNAIETIVFTYLVPGGGLGFAIQNVRFGGRAKGFFQLKVNGVPIAYGQVWWNHFTDDAFFQDGTVTNPGDTVTITVIGDSELSAVADFFGYVHGRLL